MRTIPCALLLLVAACGSADAPKTDGSSGAKSSAKPAANSAGPGAAKPADTKAADAKPADAPADAPAGAPADPLDDSKTPQASCDHSKTSGGCTEHYALGLGEESAQKLCETDGKWAKATSCPKPNRVAVCRTGQDRMIYYKNVIAPGNGLPEIKGLCDVLPEGKFAEVKTK